MIKGMSQKRKMTTKYFIVLFVIYNWSNGLFINMKILSNDDSTNEDVDDEY